MLKQYEMRRKDKEVTDRNWMEEVLRRGWLLHLGLAGEDGWPYVVPIGYGYADGVIYMHGAPQGRKNDILAANPKVCFQVTLDIELLPSEVGSDFTMKYRSVTGFGHVRNLTDLTEKNAALKVIMDHYCGPHTDIEKNDALKITAERRSGSSIDVKKDHGRILWVARLDIESMTGKRSVYRD